MSFTLFVNMIVIFFFIEKNCFFIFNKNQSQWSMIEKIILAKTLWSYPSCEYIKSQCLTMEKTTKTLWLFPSCEYIKTSSHSITYGEEIIQNTWAKHMRHSSWKKKIATKKLATINNPYKNLILKLFEIKKTVLSTQIFF